MSEFVLSEEQRVELEKFIQSTSDLKLYSRAKLILYKTEYSERSQWYWIARYREDGLSGLRNRPRSGRSPQDSDLSFSGIGWLNR